MTLQAYDLYHFRTKNGVQLACVELDDGEHELVIEASYYTDEEAGSGREFRRVEVKSVYLNGREIEVEGLENIL